MAYFSRLIALLILVLPFTASAVIPTVAGWRVSLGPSNFSVPSFDVAGCKSGVAQAYGAGSSGLATTTFTAQSATNGMCNGSWGAASIYQYGQQCPANSTAVSGGCACKSGFVEEGGSCVVAPPECGPNQQLDTETNTCTCKTGPAGSFAVSGDTYIGCNDGCRIVLQSGSYSGTTKKTYGSWRQTSDTCTPSPDLPGVDAPGSPSGQDAGKCPTGQCPGSVNGTFMCVPCKGKESSDNSSSESSSQTPNGASAPESTSNGSSNSSKQTECANGECVTKEKVIVSNPDGSTTEQNKETREPQSDYCTKNPKAEICKAAESSWGGDCASGFQGTGDAVQVATAKAVWESRCALNEGPDQATQDTMNALKTWSMSELNMPDLTVSAPSVEASTCSLGDIAVNIGQFAVTLPLSTLCPYLAVIHKVITSFGMLMWLLIVFVRGK